MPRATRRSAWAVFLIAGLSSPALLLAQPVVPDVTANTGKQKATPNQTGLGQVVGSQRAGRKGVEEITVTAQKRSENVRKVPLSVTVLSGAQIRAAHITNFADLTRSVPNLSFSSQAGEGLSNLEIRGISSSAGTATVALYLDDVSLTTRNLPTEGAVEPRFLDISRVEVLRGPQSTLYGASALGGTLRYISNQPVMDKFQGNVFSELSGTYHGSVNWDEQGVLNIPIIDNQLVLRLAGETGIGQRLHQQHQPEQRVGGEVEHQLDRVQCRARHDGVEADRLADGDAERVFPALQSAGFRRRISDDSRTTRRRSWLPSLGATISMVPSAHLQRGCGFCKRHRRHWQLRAAVRAHAGQLGL